MIYTYEQAYQASLEYFCGEELSAKTFVDKYALRDKDNNILEPTPEFMHLRLAKEFARIDAENYGLDFEERRISYFNIMKNFEHVVPQGSPMAAIGNNYQLLSASNCVVIEPPHDNVADIFRAGHELAELYKRRAGCGTDLSHLRPDGMAVNNAARTTSGAWSFADFYSNITRMIAIHGRRGALMLTMDVHHPDVEKFATMKHDLTKVTGANISVRLSNEFLIAVENDEEYEQRWPCEGTPLITKKVMARDVWATIIESATKTAEPGLIFWDHMCDYSPSHCYPYLKNKSTNPCSEIPLGSFDSCRLISINLTGYVRNAFRQNSRFDLDEFKSDIINAVQMADNLVDIELEQVAKIMAVSEKDGTGPGTEHEMWGKFYETGKRGRRVGLGTHGLADMLAQLGFKYDSDEAIKLIDFVYENFRNTAYRASVELAKQRGPFPDWNKALERGNKYLEKLPDDIRTDIAKYGRRNVALLTNAPTGSVSIVSKVGKFSAFNVSSGIEPVFRVSYTRRKKINQGDQNTRVDFVDETGDKWQHFPVFHNNVKCYLDEIGGDKIPEFFVSSDQIDWRKRVEIQGVIQKNIDHSISSTINLPLGTNSDVVGNVYLAAWRKGCKGITVYVDGSRDGVLVTDTSTSLKNKVDELEKELALLKNDNTIQDRRAPKRPRVLVSETHKVKIDFGDENPRNAYVTVSFFGDTKRPYEVLVIAPYFGLNEKDLQILELAARMTSMNLRHGLPLEFICEQLDKIGGQYIFSIPTNIARILRGYIPENTDENLDDEENTKGLLKCPECGKRTYRPTGQTCGVCNSCSFSGCG